MERQVPASWKLVVARPLLAVVLPISLMLQLVMGMLGVFDIHIDENMLRNFWSRVGISDVLPAHTS